MAKPNIPIFEDIPEDAYGLLETLAIQEMAKWPGCSVEQALMRCLFVMAVKDMRREKRLTSYGDNRE